VSTAETTGTTGKTEAAAAPGALGAPDAPRLTDTAAPAEAPREGLTAAWTPLQHPLFRAMWMAAAVSNIGTWMQNVGAAWLMTSLAPVPTMVALVQASTALPMLLFGLPAGALADVLDRRRLLLVTQSWMLVMGMLLAALTGLDAVGPWLLLGLTFAIGLGNAATAPAWQAIMPELVPRPEMPKAVALNSVTYNIARAVGPALAGVIIAATSPAAVFLLNAVSVVGVLVVVFRWRPQARESELPPEERC
jgi:MFS family permease